MTGYRIVSRHSQSVTKPFWDRPKVFKSSDLIHYTGEHYSTFIRRANSAAGQIVWPHEVYHGVQRIFDDYEAFQLLTQNRLVKAGLNSSQAAALVVDLKPTFLPDETLFCVQRSSPLPDPVFGDDWPKRQIENYLSWKKSYEGKRDAILKIARASVARRRQKDAEDLESLPVFYAHTGKVTEFESLLRDPDNKSILVVDVHAVQREVEAIRILDWKRKNARKS